MERRKLLIGSGAALTTALAGCFGTDDDGSDDPEEGREEGGGTDDEDDHDENGDDYEDEDDDSDDEEYDDEDYDDVPGFDSKDLDVDSDKVSVDHVKLDGDVVDVKATTTTTDRDALYAEFESLARDVERPMHDIDEFDGEISLIQWTIVDDEGTTVATFYVKAEWIRMYDDDELTDEQFLEMVLETMD